MMNQRIADNCPELEAYQWIWEVFLHYTGHSESSIDSSHVIGSNDSTGLLSYNSGFWNNIRSGEFRHNVLLNEDHCITFQDGSVDRLMTAFYFINCLFERDPEIPIDDVGRTEFSTSVWKERSMSIHTPFVNRLFDELAPELGIEVVQRKSGLWFSHDIDSVYGAWLQDGKWQVKNKKFLSFCKTTFQHFFVRPQWLNLSQIAEEERKRGVMSTFFFLTEKGIINERKRNADYLLADKGIRKEITTLRSFNQEIGLHKSLNSGSYAEESAKIGNVTANRNHYLAISWPNDLWKQHEAQIDLDASLGYAENYGFKNGYSLPFYPFDLEKRQVIPVLEVPLHLMDGTFSAYLKLSPEEAYHQIEGFLGNNAHNAVISVLWHNSHFTDYKYKGFPEVYWKVIETAKKSGLEVLTMNDLRERFPKTTHKQLR